MNKVNDIDDMDQIKWWGYLHQNGTVHVKRWFGDHGDYTTDCGGNSFVVAVVPPFASPSRVSASRYVENKLKETGF